MDTNKVDIRRLEDDYQKNYQDNHLEFFLKTISEEEIPCGNFYTQYVEWCTEYGYTPKSKLNLNKSMQEKGYIKKTMRFGNQTKKVWLMGDNHGQTKTT